MVCRAAAILHDPQVRLAPQRAARMLAYAADTVRGAATTPTRARLRPPLITAALNLLLVAGLMALAGAIWVTVQAPGKGSNYLQLAWCVFVVAWPLSECVHSGKRAPTLIFIGGILTGGALNLWNAAQAPQDWWHYLLAAWLLLVIPAWWVIARRARTRRAPGRGMAAARRDW